MLCYAMLCYAMLSYQVDPELAIIIIIIISIIISNVKDLKRFSMKV